MQQAVCILSHEEKALLELWQIRTGLDQTNQIFQIRTRLDSIFSDQDWSLTEKSHSLLISAGLVC